MTLPPIPKDRDWNEATWRAGWSEACELSGIDPAWNHTVFPDSLFAAVTAHAITLLDAGIVKPVVSEAEQVYADIWEALGQPFNPELEWAPGGLAAIAVIQAALDRARGGSGI